MPTEIVLPDEKPAFEWICGEAVQKVRPKRAHGVVQYHVARALDEWAGESGDVATEWRFRITPPGEGMSVLVPDVAYLADARSASLEGEDREEPPFAPNVAVEIRSPDDRQARIDEKVRVYLAGGADVVLVIDPAARTAVVSDVRMVNVFEIGMLVAHPKMPGFALDLAALFSRLER